MGETLAETRLEIDSKRTELERTTAQLRDALDIRKRFQENPALVIGIGAGAAFLLVGGPMRVARLVRRQFFPSNPEKAYDSLPKPMQAWVDHMSGAVGPRASEARQVLAEELVRWRHDPRKHGKVSKKLAQADRRGSAGSAARGLVRVRGRRRDRRCGPGAQGRRALPVGRAADRRRAARRGGNRGRGGRARSGQPRTT